MASVVINDDHLYDIGDAIREKLGTSDTYLPSEMPPAIRSITGGGGGGAVTEPLDPWEVYRNTRPPDWLTMPEPQSNEIYMLFHIPSGVSSLVAFAVTCTGSYTVELGTVTGGAFVPSSSTSVSTGSKYEAELLAADYGNLTSDGMKQVMIRVSGTAITKWEQKKHSKITHTGIIAYNILEISAKLPNITSFQQVNTADKVYPHRLRYFALYGENSVSDGTNMFNSCISLTSVMELDTRRMTSTVNMFFNCRSLIAVPDMDLSLVRTASGMYRLCQSITAIPDMITPVLTTTQDIFNTCGALVRAPHMDTSKVTAMGNMYNSCNALPAVELDTPKATNMATTFGSCYSLGKVRFAAGITGWAGCAISLDGCALGHAALVELFDSLPTITASHALTITGNPGVAELTDAEKAVATGKNWTLTT